MRGSAAGQEVAPVLSFFSPVHSAEAIRKSAKHRSQDSSPCFCRVAATAVDRALASVRLRTMVPHHSKLFALPFVCVAEGDRME